MAAVSTILIIGFHGVFTFSLLWPLPRMGMENEPAEGRGPYKRSQFILALKLSMEELLTEIHSMLSSDLVTIKSLRDS